SAISFMLLLPPPPHSTLFPYTTLFRSVQRSQRIRCDTFRVRRQRYPRNRRRRPSRVEAFVTVTRSRASRVGGRYSRQCPRERGRSEEHTSELQSRGHLVCRLLLEKKKK